MSLILDALRRADRARDRDVASRIAQAPPPLARRASAWPWLVACVVAVAAAAVAWWPRAPTAPPPARATSADRAVARPTPPPASSTLADIPLPAATTAAAEPAVAPLRDALPAAIRASLPSVELDAHVWAEDPARRFVMVGGRLLRVGDHAAEGLVLTAVTPDGAEFAWRGTRFRVPAR